MKCFLIIFWLHVFVLSGVSNTMAVEEAQYRLVTKNGYFEVRDYPSHAVAETIVEGDLEDAGSKAFKLLFGYISGENQPRVNVDMTAPVSQQASSDRIEMTAPVSQQPTEDNQRWIVAFMMPATTSMDTLPEPVNPKVTLRQVPERRMAVVRYSGFWNEKGYLENKSKLEAWIIENGYTIVGDPIWARYNPPFTPWFMRRNEILMAIDSEVHQEPSLKMKKSEDAT